MALTDNQKIRLGIAIGHMRREAGWQTVRQFCVAESAADEPDYQGLRDYILELVSNAVTEDIQSGIDARGGQKP